MAHTDASGMMTGKPLIESDRVEGTDVYDPRGNNIGSIKRLMIEKMSGKVAYAVMAFGGFLGIGEEEHTIPWSKLTYDTILGGYRTDITEEQLRGAPSFYRDRDYDWSDRRREQRSFTTTGVRPPIGVYDQQNCQRTLRTRLRTP
jgi:PRC-barrel domain